MNGLKAECLWPIWINVWFRVFLLKIIELQSGTIQFLQERVRRPRLYFTDCASIRMMITMIMIVIIMIYPQDMMLMRRKKYKTPLSLRILLIIMLAMMVMMVMMMIWWWWWRWWWWWWWWWNTSGNQRQKTERIKPRWTRPLALSFYTFSLSPDFYVFSLPLRSRGICKRIVRKSYFLLFLKMDWQCMRNNDVLTFKSDCYQLTTKRQSSKYWLWRRRANKGILFKFDSFQSLYGQY